MAIRWTLLFWQRLDTLEWMADIYTAGGEWLPALYEGPRPSDSRR